ncbi:MAG: AAA family ATPase [Candidatus Bathyarchaeia archaeon]|jgi:exonuclease SbcC
MMIQRITLQGIRSWEKGEIKFEEGFTAILGPKGAGKSSIIDALEFALFGDEAFPEYSGVVKEGLSKSEVVLTVEDQGKIYQILRGLVRDKKAIKQDPSRLRITVNDVIYTRGKATDLNRDITNFLRVDKNLLEHTCLTKQEELKSLLNTGASNRKQIVDELLELHDFDTAWDELGDIITGREKYLEGFKETAGKYDLEALAKKYDETVQEIDARRKERETLQTQHDTEKTKLEELTKTVEKLDKDAQQYMQLKRQIEEQQKELANEKDKAGKIDGQITTHEQMLGEAETETKQLQAEISKLWNNVKEAGYKEEETVEALSLSISKLNQSIQEFSNTISVDENALSQEDKKETELSGKEDCPYCGQPLSTHKTEQFRKERQAKIESLKKAIAENKTLLTEATSRRDTYQKVHEEISKLLDRLEQQERQVREHGSKLQELQQQKKEIQSVIGDIENQIKALEAVLPPYDEETHTKKRNEQMEQSQIVSRLEGDLRVKDTEIQNLGNTLNEVSKRIQEGKEIYERLQTHTKIVEELKVIRKGCRAVLPDLRSMYLDAIESYVQKTYNQINPTSTFLIRIDENYTPYAKVGGYTRSYRDLSGGERTEIALAYRIGLGNAIYEARTGTPMELLILDEPTENLGNEEEDRSIEHLAHMLANLKVRQIITITHDQTFARFADHTIQIRKVNEQSQAT